MRGLAVESLESETASSKVREIGCLRLSYAMRLGCLYEVV
jgi:hypothetical protein